jgi:ABC-type transport system involved in cytochrome bd biosynthesis fused ATPase/permease subunit
MTLSGGAAATSATLSLLPGDMCTPLAEQLAELAKYFLLILSALYLEKFLISLSGYISFMILIPLACLFVCIAVVAGKQNLTRTAVKIALIGVIIFGIVPASVKLSDMVYQTQASKVNDAIDDYNNLEIEGDAESGLFNEFSTITTETIENVSSFMDNLLESLAVMIVTSCVIPLLVFFFLVWLVKIVFSANILVLDTTSLEALAKRPLG